MTKTLNEYMAGVMGWTLEKTVTEYGVFWWYVKPDKSRIQPHTWNPDTDHNDAFRVVEKMDAEGWRITITSSSSGDSYIVDVAKTDTVTGEYRWGRATAPLDELPDTICLAIFTAIEGKEWSDE